MMLALRPKIHPLETMHAYTLRLANANGLNRIPSTCWSVAFHRGLRHEQIYPACRFAESLNSRDKTARA